MTQVFISYAREDIESARNLRDSLTSAGLETWFDEDNLLPGMNWKTEITEAIQNSRYFVAVLSNNSVGKRGFVQKEFKQALDVLDEFPENEVFLIPVRIDDCSPTYTKLKKLHRVDLFPNWSSGVEKILLTMEIEAGDVNTFSQEEIFHPRDKPFHMSATWTDDGLEIEGGNIKILGKDSMRLFRVWADWVPEFVERESPEHGIEDAYERAFITGALRAFHEVFNAVPSEEEMERGSSILSRKMNLFFSFSRDLYVKARKRGIDPREYLFEERSQSLESDGVLGPDDKRNLYRTLLHAYVSRVCDVNLDHVEQIENAMRDAFPDLGGVTAPWEELVEGVYEVDEEMILKAYRIGKDEHSTEPEDQIVNTITAYFIKACTLEEFSYTEDESLE